MFRCLKYLIDSSITDAKEVIKRAHNGERFTLYGCQLHVSEYRPPPVDPFKVYNNLEGNDNIQLGGAEESCRTILVTGLSSDVTKDALELYFENKKKTGGGEIVSAAINEKKMEVIIEFKEHEGILLKLSHLDKKKSYYMYYTFFSSSYYE
jgi:hypothetical protein